VGAPWAIKAEDVAVPSGQTRTFGSCALHFRNMPAAQHPVASARIKSINLNACPYRNPKRLSITGESVDNHRDG
jgi:hypothetical protein